MTQTQDLQAMYGATWISNISYLFSPSDISWVVNNGSVAQPGYALPNFGIEEDIALSKQKLTVTVKVFTDDPNCLVLV
jgi:hypothetical protein